MKLPLRAVLPTFVLIGAFLYSFVPQSSREVTAPPSSVASLAQAERAIEVGETLASRVGSRAAFAVLHADGEPLMTTEMKGAAEPARSAAFRAAICLATSLRASNAKHAARAAKEQLIDGAACHAAAAALIRRGKTPVAIVSVAGASQAQNEQILGATLASLAL